MGDVAVMGDDAGVLQPHQTKKGVMVRGKAQAQVKRIPDERRGSFQPSDPGIRLEDLTLEDREAIRLREDRLDNDPDVFISNKEALDAARAPQFGGIEGDKRKRWILREAEPKCLHAYAKMPTRKKAPTFRLCV